MEGHRRFGGTHIFHVQGQEKLEEVTGKKLAGSYFTCCMLLDD
jgi:hypothetical protein